MKLRMLGLATLAALMAMAFVGTSSASAGSTTLCTGDGTGCGITHVHASTLSGAKAKLLSSVILVECDVLFLGDVLTALAAPLVIHGNFIYTNCTNGCEVTEVSFDSLIEVLRTAHELGKVTGEGEVRVHCGFFIDCIFNGEGLIGHAFGPLLSSELNGSVTISEGVLNKVEGWCPPSLNKLDITVTPLIHTYLSA